MLRGRMTMTLLWGMLDCVFVFALLCFSKAKGRGKGCKQACYSIFWRLSALVCGLVLSESGLNNCAV